MNAATVEFLLDPDGRFWFLEVNTRLQVEHGVTELVGRCRHRPRAALRSPPAGRCRADVHRRRRAGRDTGRHAIEVRLSAEDPARDFAPAPGRIGRWEMPAGPGVRVDTGVGAGDRVPPDYDPLIAKLMVVDADRDRRDRPARRAPSTRRS